MALTTLEVTLWSRAIKVVIFLEIRTGGGGVSTPACAGCHGVLRAGKTYTGYAGTVSADSLFFPGVRRARLKNGTGIIMKFRNSILSTFVGLVLVLHGE